MPVTPEIAARYNRSDMTGAVVVEVMQDSPAFRAGVRPGDIVLRVGSRDVETYGDVIDEIGRMQVGSTTSIVVWRGAARITLQVRIAERR
jgi:S1-C subfamily serine protease